MSEIEPNSKEALAQKAIWLAEGLLGGRAPVPGTDGQGGSLAKGLEDLGPLLVELVERHVVLEKFAQERLAALEQIVLDLVKDRNALAADMLKDAGTWKSTKDFTPGMVTTYRGQIWVCRASSTNIRPGTSDHWRLMAK